jgi:hypothetical protein
MPTGRRKPAQPPSANQLAKFGHVAAAISAAMKAKGMSKRDLGRALKPDSAHPEAMPWYWINARGAPGPRIRAKVAKVLGLTEAQVTPMPAGATPREAAAVHALVPALGAPLAPVKSKAADVLTFNVDASGEARIRLDVSLPVGQAVPLLRMILDAGLILSSDGGG